MLQGQIALFLHALGSALENAFRENRAALRLKDRAARMLGGAFKIGW